ncbi:MAG: hypothetical protein K8I00_05990, partial [Candidatus Omnitrophica bacterium]|nr:hypothetical protein [Candidatus Omnitrophota bacterium]
QEDEAINVRASNLFAGLFVVLVLFQFIDKLTQSRPLAVIGCLAYLSSPGIFIRSCFATHFGYTACFFVLLAYQHVFRATWSSGNRRGQWVALLPGFLAGLINQKLIILVFVIYLSHLWQNLRMKEKAGPWWSRFCSEPITLGYILGLTAFSIYGLSTNYQAFYLSFIRVHTLDRILPGHSMFAADYPALLTLWREFVVEFPLGLFAVPCLGFAMWQYRLKPVAVLAAWFVVGALVFSVVDWKLTYHLMYLVPPCIILMMLTIGNLRPKFRNFAQSAILAGIVFNLVMDVALLIDFRTYLPTGGW